MTLIRNADDFGKNGSVNRAIDTCFTRGFLERTTLMVNMPGAEEALHLAEKGGYADRVGIHLNLTEGRPLSEKIRKNPLFCDPEGIFHAEFRQHSKNRLYMDRETRSCVYEELDAQLKRYREFGLHLWHIDSHHHVHTDLPIYRMLRKLSDQYPFSSIRLSRNLYVGGNGLNRLYKTWYNASLTGICAHTGDYFGSAADYRNYPKKERLAGRETEIMLHPLYAEDGMLLDTKTPMEEVQKFFADNS